MQGDSNGIPRCTLDGRVAVIRLAQSSKRNALDARALALLERAIGEAHDAADRRVVDCVVLRGEGETFCSGFDLALCAEEPRRVEELLVGLSACVRALRMIDAPVVVRVQGAALAGGCALAVACDFVVVADDAQLGYPVHRIGISPAVNIPALLSRMGPSTRALLVSNDLLDGCAAVERGLATHCAPRESLDAEVEALVARLLAKGPEALRATKRLIRRIEETGSGAIGPARGIDDRAFAETREASVALGGGDEFADMLRVFWAARVAGRPG